MREALARWRTTAREAIAVLRREHPDWSELIGAMEGSLAEAGAITPSLSIRPFTYRPLIEVIRRVADLSTDHLTELRVYNGGYDEHES